jgi:hypothetical protein
MPILAASVLEEFPMKKILIAGLAAVLASCATAPGPTPAAPQAPAAAKPAPVTAPAAAQTITRQEALPVSVQSYYPNGDLSSSVKTTYDAQGRLLVQQTSNGNGVLVETRTGAAKGDLWRITVTNAQTGQVSSFEDLTLGPQGELLAQVFLDAKEMPQAANEYAYDKWGRKTLWLAKTGAGSLQAKTVYSYDEKGNNVKTELYDAGGTLTNVFASTFDAQSHILTRQGFDASQNLVEQTNFTWQNGLKVKEETVKPLLRTTDYTYTDNDAPTGIVSSVRGKVVERQVLAYQWFTRITTVTP